jgi:hypothetical protein
MLIVYTLLLDIPTAVNEFSLTPWLSVFREISRLLWNPEIFINVFPSALSRSYVTFRNMVVLFF